MSDDEAEAWAEELEELAERDHARMDQQFKRMVSTQDGPDLPDFSTSKSPHQLFNMIPPPPL